MISWNSFSFIRQDNGLNDWLKLVKNGRKENRKWTKWRLKPTKQEMNWKSRIQKLTSWRTKNGWRTAKNDRKASWKCSRKCLRSVTEAPRLGFSSQKHVFPPKTPEMHSIGVRDPLEQPPLGLFIEKKGWSLPPRSPRRALLAQASRWLSQEVSWGTPILLSSPPFFL